jgi:hypothetical protein
LFPSPMRIGSRRLADECINQAGGIMKKILPFSRHS